MAGECAWIAKRIPGAFLTTQECSRRSSQQSFHTTKSSFDCTIKQNCYSNLSFLSSEFKLVICCKMWKNCEVYQVDRKVKTEWIDKWMNEWMNEWLIDWLNDWLNDIQRGVI